jgi:hypothetical protein
VSKSPSGVVKLSFVSILAEGEGKGQFVFPSPTEAEPWSVPADPDPRERERYILVGLAGTPAEARVVARYNKHAYSHDAITAFGHAQSLNDDLKEADRIFRRLERQARDLIEDPCNWAGVESLVQALLADQILGYRSARQVFYEGKRGAAARRKKRTSPGQAEFEAGSPQAQVRGPGQPAPVVEPSVGSYGTRLSDLELSPVPSNPTVEQSLVQIAARHPGLFERAAEAVRSKEAPGARELAAILQSITARVGR